MAGVIYLVIENLIFSHMVNMDTHISNICTHGIEFFRNWYKLIPI